MISPNELHRSIGEWVRTTLELAEMCVIMVIPVRQDHPRGILRHQMRKTNCSNTVQWSNTASFLALQQPAKFKIQIASD